MASTDSSIIARPEIDPITSSLLKMPLGLSMDLFQVLDGCQMYVDVLIENDNNTERMALCGRLLAGLEVLRVLLDLPLPQRLIERLTADNDCSEDCMCSFSTDSETLRRYCSALTMLLLNQQESEEQNALITGMLHDMVSLLNEDLKAPRFIRTEKGLVMISGEEIPDFH